MMISGSIQQVSPYDLLPSGWHTVSIPQRSLVLAVWGNACGKKSGKYTEDKLQAGGQQSMMDGQWDQNNSTGKRATKKQADDDNL